MKSKLYILTLAVLASVLFSISGCAKYEQIKVTSGKIESISLSGLKAVDVIVKLDVDNPAGKVEVKSAEGVVKHFGKVIGKVTPDPVVFMPRTLGEYKVMLRVEIAEGLGFKELMTFTDLRKLNECTLDVTIAGKAAGVALKKKYENIPLKKLLEGR